MLPRPKDLLICLVILGPPFFFWLTYSGPFQWLAELQLAWFHGYEVTITLLLTMFAWLAALAALLAITTKARGRPFNASNFSANHQHIINRATNALFAAAPIALLAIAGYLEFLHHTTHDLAHLDMAAFVQGASSHSRYVALDNAAVDPDNAQSMEENDDGPSKSATHFLPLLPQNYRPGDPVHAFVEVDEKDVPKAQAQPELLTHGLIAFTGLPGMVRVAFQRANMPPAPRYILLRFNTTPADYHSDAITFTIIAAVIFTLGLFNALMSPWRTRRKNIPTSSAPPSEGKSPDSPNL